MVAKRTKSDINKKYGNWVSLTLQLIVVFIGVTMGFFLNNWSAKQQDLKLEEKYKVALIADIDIHISTLKGFIHQDSIWILRAQEILRLSKKDPDIKYDSLQVIFELITSANLLLPQKSTFQSMENSGEMNLISNFELKGEINRYYGVSLLQVELAQNQFFDFIQNTVTPFAFQTFDSESQRFLSPKKSATQYINFLVYALKRRLQILSAYQNLLGHSYFLRGKLSERPT